MECRKSSFHLLKQGVRFEPACEVFFESFVRMIDAGTEEEARDAALGTAEDWALLSVVHLIREEREIRTVSARPATGAEE